MIELLPMRLRIRYRTMKLRALCWLIWRLLSVSRSVPRFEAKLGERRGGDGSNQHAKVANVEKIPQLLGEKTRDLAAERCGFGNGKTYEQAKAIVVAAAAAPGGFEAA
jgi:hypothetical protein